MKLCKLTTALLAIALLIGCSKVDRDWRNASRENTVSAYDAHLAAFPNSPHSREAGTRIESIEWAVATSENTSESYNIFIQTHPKSAHSAEAGTRRDEILWKQATVEKTVAGYERYLAASPDGRQRSEAKLAMEETLRRNFKADAVCIYRGDTTAMWFGKVASQMSPDGAGWKTVLPDPVKCNVAVILDCWNCSLPRLTPPLEVGNIYVWRGGTNLVLLRPLREDENGMLALAPLGVSATGFSQGPFPFLSR